MLNLNDRPAVSIPMPPRPLTPRALLIRELRQRTANVPGTYVLLAVNVAMFAAVAIAAGSSGPFSTRRGGIALVVIESSAPTSCAVRQRSRTAPIW